jgi:hypothetical protein
MNEPLRLRRYGNNAHLLALAFNSKMHDAFAPLIIAHAKLTRFLAADAVKEQGRQYRPVANTFGRLCRRRLQELPSLHIAERRRRPFVVVRLRPLHALDWIIRYGVPFTEILKKRRQRRELPANGRWRQMPALEVLTPGNHVCPGDEAEFLGAMKPDKGAEIGDVKLIGAAGFPIGDVRKRLELGRDLG